MQSMYIDSGNTVAWKILLVSLTFELLNGSEISSQRSASSLASASSLVSNFAFCSCLIFSSSLLSSCFCVHRVGGLFQYQHPERWSSIAMRTYAMSNATRLSSPNPVFVRRLMELGGGISETWVFQKGWIFTGTNEGLNLIMSCEKQSFERLVFSSSNGLTENWKWHTLPVKS